MCCDQAMQKGPSLFFMENNFWDTRKHHFKRAMKFEYKITAIYLLVGGLWILFSDYLLLLFVDKEKLTMAQTYKGWFYVIVTALIFFFFLRSHLRDLRQIRQELERHKHHLQQLVKEKTIKLDAAIGELKTKNKRLSEKNKLIKKNNARLEKALKDLKEKDAQLIQADKMASLGTLTAGVAHEINNPLNYIHGGAEGLERYFREERVHHEELDLFLSSIRTGVERAGAIVAGLNQFSRDSDHLDEEVEIHEVIENVISILRNEFKKRVEIVRDFIGESVVVRGNAGKLHQVFTNLLINAGQAIEKQGTITIQTGLKKNAVFIRISDTGCGISEKGLKKVTEPFYTTKSPGEGTGLGLYITYNIIRAHGGQMVVKSELNKGTTVVVELPTK